MKIVIDTNRIIAALIKQGTTRDILFDNTFEFVTPDHTLAEIQKYKDEIKLKAGLTDEEFDILLVILFEYITVMPEVEYSMFIAKCQNVISDPSDVPFLAVCLAVNAAGIWAHDPHFLEQKIVKVFTNIDMLKLSRTE